MSDRRDDVCDDEDDALGEGNDPDNADFDSSDEPALIECPYCRKSVSEETERCHHCGMYISDEDAPRRIPWLILVGFVLAAVVVLMWIT